MHSNYIIPDNRTSFRQLVQIFRSPVIRQIDLSQLYKNVKFIFEEGESLCKDFPQSGLFQLAFQNIQEFSMDYNKKTNRENGFSEGLNVFVQERIANRIFYRIITKGNGVYIPTMSILFEDVCIAYLGDIERIERYGGIRFCFPMPDMNFHG